MTDFPFKPGDRVTLPGQWAEKHTLTVTGVGKGQFLATGSDGVERAYNVGGNWTLVPPPIRRYTVEIRPAQPGEQYLTADIIFFLSSGDPIHVRTNDKDQAPSYNQIVIIEDHTEAS